MPFNKSDDVYVIPTIETGEVMAVITAAVEYDVHHDSDQSRAKRQEPDLRNLPYHERRPDKGFLWIFNARKTSNGRKLDVKACLIRKDGSLGTARRVKPPRPQKPSPTTASSASGTAGP